MNEIHARDIGPIKAFDGTVKPGVNVLKGPNGGGKSKLQAAVNFALTKTGEKPTPRDGCQRGTLEAFGVLLRVAGKVTTKGEMLVENITGRLDISQLIEPGYKDPAVNDRHRIRKLIELSGARAALETFDGIDHELPDVPEDLLEAADVVRDEMHRKARAAEEEARKAEIAEEAARARYEGVDTTGETDETVLRAAVREADREVERVEQQRIAREQAVNQAAKARTALEAARDRGVPDLEVLGDKKRLAAKRLSEAEQCVTDLRASLESAEQQERMARQRCRDVDKEFAHAEQQRETINAWETQIDEADQVEPVTDEQIEAANERLQQAEAAQERAREIRAAKAAAREQDEAHERFLDAQHRATHCRMNAAATDDILARELARLNCPWVPIGIEQGSQIVRRLVTAHRRGDQTFVGDLSAGERARDAVNVALELVGEPDRPALLIVRQEVWEGLQPRVQGEIHRHGMEKGVCILAAQATDDEEVTL